MLFSAIVFGFLGSFHCMAMCGPIAFMLPVDKFHKGKRILQIFIYHLGRLFTYSMMGFLFGLLGKGFQFFGFQQKLSIIIGLFMILIAILPKRITANFQLIKPIYRLLSRLKNRLGKELKKKRLDTFFTIGFLNGFLPCGLVYMAVFTSIALGSFLQSSAYMFLFGIGTIPLMTGFVYLGNFTSVLFRKRVQQIIPIFVVVVGVLFILRGLGLGIPFVSPVQLNDWFTNLKNCFV